MSQENLETAQATYAALDRQEFDTFVALLHPEVEFGRWSRQDADAGRHRAGR